MINELQLINNIDLLFENKIILYGAGIYGVSICNKLICTGIPVDFFCDSNSEKWGNDINGIKIISPEQLKKLDEHEEIVIIITTDREIYITQIFDVLEKMQIKTDKVLTILGLEILFAQNANNPRTNQGDSDFLLQADRLRKEIVSCERKIGYSWLALDNLHKIRDVSILSYHPRKVGSSTIVASLNAIGLRNIQLHNLNFTNILPAYPELSGVFEKYINRFEKIKIITSVREPLSRHCSDLFQRLGKLGAYEVMSSGDSFVDACTKWMKKEAFALSNENHCYGFEFDWFNYELKTVVGIDVFAHPFDREKGYSIIKQGNIEVLLMKLEKMNSLETVIGEYVGAPNFKLVNANEGKNKPYKYLYKNVMEVIKIPREIVSLYYDGNQRMDHFYTEEEKAVFLKKWENNIAK